MDSENLLFAGFWKRFAAHVLDRIILSMIFLNYLSFFRYHFAIKLMEWMDSGALEQWIYENTTLVDLFGLSEPFRAMISGHAYPYEIATMIGNTVGCWLLSPFFILVFWSYFAGLESSPLRATFGKLAVGLYVGDTHGERITFRKATTRHFGKVISALIFGVGFLLAGWTPKKQALHDLMTDCTVYQR
jgi:uncharacterized RDD family membrane protein YckC